MRPTARIKVVVGTDGGFETIIYDYFYFENQEIRDKAYDYLEEHSSEAFCVEGIDDLIEEFAEYEKVNYYTSNDDFDRPNRIDTREFTY